MAVLWIRSAEREWRGIPLGVEPLRLPEDLGPVPGERPGEESPRPAAVLAPARRLGRDDWVLIDPGEDRVRIDGLPLPGGIRVLSDREEILLDGGTRLFYSTDSIPRIEPFPEGEKVLTCPRCTNRIEAGAAAVRCPACGVWHHQTEEFPCWLYAPNCAACSGATALDGVGRWTPEGL